ncbi:MAG TPA: DUF2279 domain-containing protein [Kofleriaceae bacterium]|nr:DUF2279 domain-containing protein [Kofleriaceae bacterium]
MAGPEATKTPSHDPDGAVTAPPAASGSPWIDLAPAKILSSQSGDDDPHDHRLATLLTLGGLHAGFWGWAYIAWYRNHPEKDKHEFGADGLFGVNTYAGGADKLGHAWATMVLARGGTALLDAGGWKRTHAALISATMSELLFLGVEIKDYYYYEFSPGDFAFNTIGALTAVALDLTPRLDELIDFRVEYWPSKQFRYNFTNPDSPCAKRTPGQPSCSRLNIAEDYSGETYLLALHLGAFHPLRDMKYGTWSRFVDVVMGFESRNYKPPPTLLMDTEAMVPRHQTLFLGVTFNAQGLIDYLLPKQSKLRKVGHGVLEVITPPWTRIVPSKIEGTRSTTDPNMGGA